MNPSVRRSGIGALVALALLVVTLFAVPGSAGAATIHACKKRDGTIRIVGARTRCRRGQRKIRWNTQGPPGRPGRDGASGGGGGGGGQALRMAKFNTSLSIGRSASLFSADGVSYSFSCTFVLVLNAGTLNASGSSGSFYSQGVFERPSGIDALAGDIRTDVLIGSLGGGRARTIASTTTGATSEGSSQFLSVWTATVEGPNATTWIHATMDTASRCSIRGTALTVPS